MNNWDARLAWRLFNLNWLPVGLMGAVLLAVIGLTDFSIEPLAFGIPVAITLFLTLVAYRHRHAKADRADPKLVFMLGTVGQVILVTVIVGPLSYVVAAANWPLQDHAFSAIDHAMGFDSKAAVLFVNDHPALSKVLNFGYGMIKWPLLVIPIVLAKTFRFIRLQQFMTSLIVALLITVVISMLVPAIGNYQALEITASDVPNVDLTIFRLQQHDIPALREGSLRHLELFHLAGIISFPSFHTASAILYAWAFFPVRGWGPTALVLNTLMIISTPVIGAHYLIDVIAGIALAAASIAFAKWLSERLGQPSAMTAPLMAIPAGTVVLHDLPAIAKPGTEASAAASSPQ
jgi:membrane-associated phospholipid phosphatase